MSYNILQRNIEEKLEKYKQQGYDGTIHRYNDGTITYSVFEPNQIKSVSDNIGTSDRANPDIRYSKKAAKQDEVTLTPEETASETAETPDRQAEADRGAKVHRICAPRFSGYTVT